MYTGQGRGSGNLNTHTSRGGGGGKNDVHRTSALAMWLTEDGKERVKLNNQV